MKKDEQIQELADFVRGRLDADRAGLVQHRLSSDPDYAQLFELVKAMVDEAEQIDWPTTGAIAGEVSSRLIDDYLGTPSRERKTRGVRVYDSRLFPLPEGVRPAQVDTRHLKFKLEDMNLSVSLYPVSPDSYQLIGQLTGRSPETMLQVTLEKGKSVLTGEADRFNLFHFPRVPKGDYTLSLLAGGELIGSFSIDI